jgi:hypothetical protein
MKWNRVQKTSPSGGSSPPKHARRIATYSRIAFSGRTIFDWNQFSTVTWCETPSPSTIRPPEYSSIVAAAWAVATGVRE